MDARIWAILSAIFAGITVILRFTILREKVEPKTLIGSAFIVTGVLITLK